MSDIYTPLSELKREKALAEEQALPAEAAPGESARAPAPVGDDGEGDGFGERSGPTLAAQPASGQIPQLGQPGQPQHGPQLPQGRFVARVPVNRYPLRFTGDAGEYFRIWIVNVALTLATLGIYAAWAKVRTRRYFYANTLLDGQPFDYLATPGAILKGHLIVGSLFILIHVFNNFRTLSWVGGVLSLIFALFLPFFIYKAHRFKAHNSAYRNLRFRFHGTLGEAYKTYMLYPVLFGLPVIGVLVAMGVSGFMQGGEPHPAWVVALLFTMLVPMFAYPYFLYLFKCYTFKNMGFGTKPGFFKGKLSEFYMAYLLAMLLWMGVGLVLGIFSAIFFGVFAAVAAAAQGEPSSTIILVATIVSYVVSLLGFSLVQQFLYARITNHCAESFRLGPLQFRSNLNAATLAWIRVSNVAAIVMSLGLATPWARIRRARYVFAQMEVVAIKGNLDEFHAAETKEVQSMGDAAADFFDMEIGWDLGW